MCAADCVGIKGWVKPAGVCTKCDNGCAACTGTADNCTECEDGLFHNSGTNTCESSTDCPTEEALDPKTNACEACGANVEIC